MILFATDISCRRRVTSLSITWRLDSKRLGEKRNVGYQMCQTAQSVDRNHQGSVLSRA